MTDKTPQAAALEMASALHRRLQPQEKRKLDKPEWINVVRFGGNVRRAHVVPHIVGTHTNAEHSHGVAVMALWLTEGKASANLLRACLLHDIAEQHTGDAPATIKWASEDIRKAIDAEEDAFLDRHGIKVYDDLTPEEQQILKWADTFDLMLFCRDQLMLGNQFVRPMFNNCLGAMTAKLGELSPRAIAMLHYINYTVNEILVEMSTPSHELPGEYF